MAMWKFWQPDNDSIVAIWKIEESPFFFEQALKGNLPEIKIPKRYLEFLASRYLLKTLLPEIHWEEIQKDSTGKPFIPNSPYQISISHSFPYVAVGVDKAPNRTIGLDIQLILPKITRLQNKFLSPQEQSLFQPNHLGEITLAWTAKEAAFKWYGTGGLDFIGQMPLISARIEKEDADLTLHFQKDSLSTLLSLKGGIQPDFSWAIVQQ